MDIEKIIEKSNLKIKKEKILFNEPMKKHTAFKIGGPADTFIKVDSIEDLKEILKLSKDNNIPINIIGNGSNLLVTDKGIRGIVLKIDLKNIEIKEKDNKIEIIADSGVPLGLLAQKILKEEITGFEQLSGIPGTIGGAVIMNAGAHGKEIKDVITEVTAMDYNGEIYKFTKEDCKFEYRRSIFQEKKYIIIQAKMLLEKGKKEDIKNKMNEYLEYRKEKQPIEYPNAGSTFKRGNDYITAQLIDQAGLKGYKIGGAEVSKKHAGFIINKENATAEDVINLVDYVTKKIKEKFSKNIKLEIEILGER
ncbi:MAG: UDP-N-acetylmuramate dehydrogenase [Clostridia bacterium]